MTKPTVSAAGGAMPKIDRADVMRRAWAIFRRTYKFPAIKFNDIGRKCFAWALRQAWVEAREAARLNSQHCVRIVPTGMGFQSSTGER